MAAEGSRGFGQGEIRCLTGLRGVAATLVMLYHFTLGMPAGTVPMQTFLQNGYLWVDLFFVLSGFVMAYAQAPLFASGYRLRAHAGFLLTRIARIYPLYAVVILESACLMAWRTPQLDVAGFGRTLLLNLGLVQAWGLAPSLEGAAWSISTEWGAYLLFPLLLAATVLGSRRLAVVAGAAALLAIGAIALAPGPFSYPGQGRSGPLDVYSPATAVPLVRCIAEFSLGLLAFRVARRLSAGPQRRAGAVALLTLAAILAALSQAGWDVLVVALFAVLLVALAPQRGVVGRVLGASAPYRLGQWSYSIYLIHDKFSHPAGTLQAWLAGQVPLPSVVAAVLMSLTVIACAAVSFFVIERPVRNWLLPFVRRWATRPPGSGHSDVAIPFRLAKWRGTAAGFRRRDVVLATAALTVAGAVFFGSAAAANALPWAPMVPLGLVAAGLAAWLVLAAMYGSPIAIMLYFAAIAFMTDAQFRVRGAGEISGDWQSALKFLIWLGAGVIGFAHMPPLRVMLARPGSACWLAYIVIAIGSSLYSPVAGYSFGCSVALLCLFAFAYTLTTRLSEAQIMWTLLLSLSVFNVGGWVVFYAVPDLGTSAAWTTSGLLMRMCGLAGQATNLGAVCATAIGAAFVLWYGRSCSLMTGLALGGFACITLLKSDARTTEIAALAGVALVIASRSVWLVAGGALSAVSGLVLLQVFPQISGLLGSSFSRSGDPTEVYTLTGRLEIWDFAWQQIKLSPIFGYGYNSSKAVLGGHIGFENGLMVDSAHNLYLQNLLSVGALGLLPLVGLLAYLVVRCCVRPIPIVCYTLVLVLVSSISDTDSIGTTPTLMTMVFFMVSIWPGLAGQPVGTVAVAPRPGRGRLAIGQPAAATAR